MAKSTRVDKAVIFNRIDINDLIEVHLISNSSALKTKVNCIVAIIRVKI